MPPGSADLAKSKVQIALRSSAKVGKLLEIAARFFQLDSMFFLMCYVDYVSISKGAVPRMNAINTMIYSGGDTLAQKLSLIGTYIYERHVKPPTSGAVGGGVGSGAPMMINLSSAETNALSTIYRMSTRPFTPTHYKAAHDVILATLIGDARYWPAYYAEL